MLSPNEKEGGTEDGQKVIFFKKGGIEWRRPAHCKYLMLVILSDQWLKASFIF